MAIDGSYDIESARNISQWAWEKNHEETGEPWDGTISPSYYERTWRTSFVGSKNVRLYYDIDVYQGGCEIVVSRDKECTDIVQVIAATEGNNSGYITFDNKEPVTYHYHDRTLSEDSDYHSRVEFQIKRSNWRQFLRRYGEVEEVY